LSRIYFIHDARGKRQLGEEALPLCVGGGLQADIVLPGAADDAVFAHIALSEGHAYIQSAGGTVSLFHNQKHFSDSMWLKSGDEVQAGDAVLYWQVRGDQVTISTQRRTTPADLVPPAGPPPASQPPGAHSTGVPLQDTLPDSVPPNQSLPDVDHVPVVTAGQRKWRRLVLAVFVVLLLATAFVLLATPLAIHITPEPARQSLSGFPPAVTLGNRLLALPGRYTVTASLEGYRPLQASVDVIMGGLQEFSLQLEELPGRVRIELQPQVPFRVFVDAAPVNTDADMVAEVPGGSHRLRLETDRYLPVESDVEIAGKGQEQHLAYSLQPAWAEVQVVSQPQGASVSLDGESVGVTPLDMEILQGSHTLVLSLEKYKPVTVQQDVLAGSNIQLDDFILEPADGELQLSSDPAGATISVAGVFYGSTPATLALSSGEEHRVRLSKPGYQVADRKVQLAPEEEQTLEVDLSPQYGVVFITARPADATLVLDGKPSGKATRRISLTTRPHQLEFRKSGYVSQRITVTPRAGVSKNVDVELKTRAQTQAVKQAAATPANWKTASGQTLRLVRPAGSFRMGASRREAGRRANESSRLVALTRPFYLGDNEVSNGEYRRFKSSHLSGSAEGAALDGDRQPVVNVSWDDAARYCNWLSKQDGLSPAYRERDGHMQAVDPATAGYRLPTEVEWAYVARKLGRQQEGRYPWNGSFPPTASVGNFADTSIADTFANTVPGYNDGYRGTAPVGSFAAYPDGFHDLGGNVAEWTHDFYAVYPAAAEKLVTDPTAPASGEHHTIRGSSWRQGSIAELRLSYRDYSRSPRPDLGFRLARYAE
jgi:formylglycine-generating enzyme required for sulfatase activity